MARQWKLHYEPVSQRVLEPDALAIFILPVQGAVLLQGLSDWLTWRSSYVDNFTDAEWDTVAALADKTRAMLMDWVTVNDLHDELVLIRQAIQAMASAEQPDYTEPLEALEYLEPLIGILAALDPEIALLAQTGMAIAEILGSEELPQLPPGT